MSDAGEPGRRPFAPPPTALSGRFDVSTLRAAWWTLWALRRTRRQLAADGVAAKVQAPPRLPPGARRGVYAILNRQPATCLEGALVLQRWLAAQGQPHDVVVGVARTGGDFSAHAWLDIQANASEAEGYHELLRLPAP